MLLQKDENDQRHGVGGRILRRDPVSRKAARKIQKIGRLSACRLTPGRNDFHVNTGCDHNYIPTTTGGQSRQGGQRARVPRRYIYSVVTISSQITRNIEITMYSTCTWSIYILIDKFKKILKILTNF